MRWFHVVGALSILLALTMAASAGDKSAKKAKNKQAVQGVVVDILKDPDKETGTLVVKLQAQKKQKAAATPAATTATDKKFQITAETKFEKRVRVAKKEFKQEAATLKDVHKGDQVTIAVAGKEATDAKTVAIAAKKKTKTKGAKK